MELLSFLGPNIVFMSRKVSLEKLPPLVERKIYKTGQTRGASNSEIYQNRVGRNSTVLIPFSQWSECRHPYGKDDEYENGFIVLISPDWYFTTPNADYDLQQDGIELGVNAVLFYQRRGQWYQYGEQFQRTGYLPNGKPFCAPVQRDAPIGGTVLSRLHATTSSSGDPVYIGFNETKLRGAGIRVYEYASKDVINRVKLQLEALFWLCPGAIETCAANGGTRDGAIKRRDIKLVECEKAGLLDYRLLTSIRAINSKHETICPLCRKVINADEFLHREEQAEGRETWDLTITEVSLFHIEELRVGTLQHRPYNLGWGHHFCNVVVKDAGIDSTLEWMTMVLSNNEFIVRRKNQNKRDGEATLFD